MKKSNLFSWLSSFAAVAFCITLTSFAFRGAHSVQIFLDSKLLVEQYINSKNDAPKIALGSSEQRGQLIVKYNECGRTVTGRKITLKDGTDKVLKEWKFEGSSTGFEGSMTCPIKEILALAQKGGNSLKLYYSSAQFPEGYKIAYLNIENPTTTASK